MLLGRRQQFWTKLMNLAFLRGTLSIDISFSNGAFNVGSVFFATASSSNRIHSSCGFSFFYRLVQSHKIAYVRTVVELSLILLFLGDASTVVLRCRQGEVLPAIHTRKRIRSTAMGVLLHFALSDCFLATVTHKVHHSSTQQTLFCMDPKQALFRRFSSLDSVHASCAPQKSTAPYHHLRRSGMASL